MTVDGFVDGAQLRNARSAHECGTKKSSLSGEDGGRGIGVAPPTVPRTPGGLGLAEEPQCGLRNGVGLPEHGRTGLLQDLEARHVGRFHRKIGIHDPATGSGLVL